MAVDRHVADRVVKEIERAFSTHGRAGVLNVQSDCAWATLTINPARRDASPIMVQVDDMREAIVNFGRLGQLALETEKLTPAQVIDDIRRICEAVMAGRCDEDLYFALGRWLMGSITRVYLDDGHVKTSYNDLLWRPVLWRRVKVSYSPYSLQSGKG